MMVDKYDQSKKCSDGCCRVQIGWIFLLLFDEKNENTSESVARKEVCKESDELLSKKCLNIQFDLQYLRMNMR